MVEVEDRRAAHIECYITRGQNDECKITIDVDLARTLPQDEERYVNSQTLENSYLEIVTQKFFKDLYKYLIWWI